MSSSTVAMPPKSLTFHHSGLAREQVGRNQRSALKALIQRKSGRFRRPFLVPLTFGVLDKASSP